MRVRAQCTLIAFEHDGLLLDLSSGTLLHLNESAMMVWSGFLDGQSQSVLAEALSSRYRLPLQTAAQHVADALDPDARAPEAPSLSPYLYERVADVYMLSRDRTPLLTIDAQGRWVRLSDTGAVPARELPMVLQAVAPKLMALRGHFVLHASAIILGPTVLAFCGRSGAGKTTTARALVRAGAVPVCEDKLVVQSRAEGFGAFVHGEPCIKSWVAEAATALSAGDSASCAGLDSAASGEFLSLGTIACLAADRREGKDFVAGSLGHSKTASALFSNAFHGSSLAEDWLQHLETAACAARAVPAYDVTAPLGVNALESAAAQVVRRGTFP